MNLQKAVLVLVLAGPCLSLAQAKTPAASKGVEQQLIKLENEWNDAVVKRDAAALEKIEADDYTFIDAEGTLWTKAQDVATFKSGDYVATSMVADELKVRVYGHVAVVTGRNTIKAQFKGKDISGQYRYTDTWVKRGGRWQCVATHSSKIAPK